MLVVFLLLNFGPPLYWGMVGGGLIKPLAWSVGMMGFAISTGWRAPERGLIASIIIGFSFAAIACVPVYFIGRGIASIIM